MQHDDVSSIDPSDIFNWFGIVFSAVARHPSRALGWLVEVSAIESSSLTVVSLSNIPGDVNNWYLVLLNHF